MSFLRPVLFRRLNRVIVRQRYRGRDEDDDNDCEDKSKPSSEDEKEIKYIKCDKSSTETLCDDEDNEIEFIKCDDKDLCEDQRKTMEEGSTCTDLWFLRHPCQEVFTNEGGHDYTWCGKYQSPEYHLYHKYSYYDVAKLMDEYRIPQPKGGKQKRGGDEECEDEDDDEDDEDDCDEDGTK